MIYTLPVSISIGETEYNIRWDYRAVLDICTALSDPELSQQDKVIAMLEIFYPDFEKMPPDDYQEAVDACLDFISCGEEESGKGKKAVKLVDWEQDFKYIAPAVNKVLGREIRGPEQLHWWTFVGAYYEIGECLFSQIVRIRTKKAYGKKLDKNEQEWYRKNRQIVDIKNQYTEAEVAALRALGLK